MKLLAIETATEALGVAVDVDGRVHARFEVAPRRHAELCLPWCDALLEQAGIGKRMLDAIAVSKGPGAFTGVRLGLSIAQGIALALDKPLIALSTLEVLAMRARHLPGFDATRHRVLAAIDARMGEIYCADFRFDADGRLTRAGEERLISNQQVPDLQDADYAVVGTGLGSGDWRSLLVERLGARFDIARCDAQALPHAEDSLILALQAHARGEAIDPALVEPAYLRDKVAMTLVEQGKA